MYGVFSGLSNVKKVGYSLFKNGLEGTTGPMKGENGLYF